MPTRSKHGRVTHVRSKRQTTVRRTVKQKQKQKQKQTVNVYINDSNKRGAKRTARSYPDRDRRPPQQRQQQIGSPQPPQIMPIPIPQQRWRDEVNAVQHHDLVRMMEQLKENSMQNLSESMQRQQSNLASAMNEALESRISELQSALQPTRIGIQPSSVSVKSGSEEQGEPVPQARLTSETSSFEPSSPEPRGEPSVRPKNIRSRLREAYTHDQMIKLVKQHMKAHPGAKKVRNYDNDTLVEYMVTRSELHPKSSE